MFLTRMALNPRRRGARPLLSSPQAMHAAVMSGFADADPTRHGRVLWRVDTHASHRVLLYTASPGKPDYTHLVEQAGWPTTHTWDTRSYDTLLDTLAPGQRWQFRVTANPVHSVRLRDWTDTKPVGHVTADQQRHWLLQRAARAGFDILPLSNAPGEYQLTLAERRTHRFRRGPHPVTLTTATYEGILQVTDPDLLRHTLTHGLGRAKSYGCGLLTLAPPRPAHQP
ncbi:type I-E CRISPR-associated protein Cas6/Cse3/CasE [Nocardia wallacei]|uniref:type I-E CRISPR-associated protein Cas6/Cse3/CasE n=1 Tax=Nocardia wallacei TaxID=480035 RepID=UPI002453F4A8|nr:type I-E CRISPR-associated protein Cas6/Cse3/CasE [Nocardia wallacei]